MTGRTSGQTSRSGHCSVFDNSSLVDIITLANGGITLDGAEQAAYEGLLMQQRDDYLMNSEIVLFDMCYLSGQRSGQVHLTRNYTAQSNQTDIDVIEILNKSVIPDASYVHNLVNDSNVDYSIVQDDPMVAWNFHSVNSGQSEAVEYILESEDVNVAVFSGIESLVTVDPSNAEEGPDDPDGPGGGSSSSAVAAAPSERPWLYIAEYPAVFSDTPLIVEPGKSLIPVDRLIISFGSMAPDYGINISAYDVRPSAVPEMELEVYRYIIADDNKPDSLLSGAKMLFWVDRRWLTDNGLPKEHISLWRFNGTWTELETKWFSESDSAYKYIAQAPGLGYFAIAGRRAPLSERRQRCEAAG